MNEDQEEKLLDKVVFTGRVVRCTVEPIYSEFYRGSSMSQVTVEIERPAIGSDDLPMRLSMATMVDTADKTLDRIQEIVLLHARKLLEHSPARP
ncbi:hypothetical protein [Cupriavidus nantongensis]